jgi:hypothetical protein
VYVAMLHQIKENDEDPPAQEVPEEYQAFQDVFDDEGAASLPEYSKRKEHAIDIEPGKQPPWGPIYSLSAKELSTLRVYIEDSLRRGWIRHSTSPAVAWVVLRSTNQKGATSSSSSLIGSIKGIVLSTDLSVNIRRVLLRELRF